MVNYYSVCPTLFEFLYLIALLIMVLMGAKLIHGGHREEEYLRREKERLKRKKRSRREYRKAQKSKKGEGMEQIEEDERISSIEGKLNSLIQQSSDLERRLGVLERSSGMPSPLAQPTRISHNYLNRVISEAWRGYKKW